MTPAELSTICGACNLLDVIKGEWAPEGCWSEWDQSIRDGLSAILKVHFEAAPASQEDKTGVKS